jgi:hypothetical protein
MRNVLSSLLERIYPNWTWNLGGQAINLERADRLSFKDGLRTRWITVQTDGTLKSGVRIDISTMNATDPTLIDEPREIRIQRACRVSTILQERGFDCEISEDGHLLRDACVEI